jgi:hypothetical protein
MFAPRYYAPRYYAPRYFPNAGADPVLPTGGGTMLLTGVGLWWLLILLSKGD